MVVRRKGCWRGRLLLVIALVVGGATAAALCLWRQQMANRLVLLDVRRHPGGARWYRWLPRDSSTHRALGREFRRNRNAAWAAAELLGEAGYPEGFHRLVELVEDGGLPPYLRWWAASQLPRIRHPRADRYVQLLLQNTTDDEMRAFVLEGFSDAERQDEHTDAALETIPRMREPLSISRALCSAASQTGSRCLLPLVLRYSEAENRILREASVAAADSLLWESSELDDKDRAQIVQMWRRIAARDSLSHANSCLYVVEHAGLPRESP